MKRIAKTCFIMIVLGLLVLPKSSIGGTEVYKLVDSPFSLYQCYSIGDWLEGPADYFGTDVCVQYDALNTVTTRIKTNKDGTVDVGWTLLQDGIATITDAVTGEVLYVGNFQVEEIGRDNGNDAGCLGGTPDEPVAWFGKCSDAYGSLEFMNYQWKITGNKVYFFKVVIKDGTYCWMDSREVLIDGGACPPGAVD